MNPTKFTLALLWCCTILLPPLFAQDLQKDLEAFQNAYQQLDKLQAEVTIKIYDQPTATEPVMTSTAMLKRYQSAYWCKAYGQTMVYSAKGSVMINDAERSIVYTPFQGKKVKTMLKALEVPGAEELLQESQSVSWFPATDERAGYYAIYRGHSPIKEMRIAIDPESHLLSSIAYLYDPVDYPDQQKVVITYNIKTEGLRFKANEFSPRNYLRIDGGKASPQPGYEGYQVAVVEIDQEP